VPPREETFVIFWQGLLAARKVYARVC
jgi:hypothetical protein